mgnify:CR=1 FL=1
MSSNLKKITSFFKSVIQNRKLSLYIFFFIISLSFWFLTVLSKTHETSLIIPVDYINYPIDLIADEAPDDYIEIRVKSSGISIISFNLFNSSSIILDFDLANYKPKENGAELFFNINSKRQQISSVLGISFDILDINPNKLSVNFVNKQNKKVPIILDSEINLRESFWLASEISTNMDSITVFGEQDSLKSIKYISTDKLKIDDLHKDQIASISLNIPNSLFSNTENILVEINVEPYIEEVISKKVNIRNLQQKYSLKLFPSNVSVTLRLPKENFSLLETNFIELFIDASDLNDKRTLFVEYGSLPNGVKIKRIYPSYLEFLLIKE